MGREHFRCRACGSESLILVLSMGEQPLANALLTSEQIHKPEPVYPLNLVFCEECSLVQLRETVSPEEMFSEYLYFSSCSDTMLKHAQEIVHRLLSTYRLNGSFKVVEIASNDGYLLQYFVAQGIPVLGIDPALNIAKVAEQKGVRTIAEYFGKDLAQRLKVNGDMADVVIANNVLAHVPDLNGFVDGIYTLLKDEGVAVIEFPYLKDMMDRCEFDTIYHEHHCYFSVTAINQLFIRHQLKLIDVERIPIHGGSLQLTVARVGSIRPAEIAVQNILDEESQWGVDKIGSYLDFGKRVSQNKISLRNLLQSFKESGKTIAGYGAAAKATVLLNHYGIGPETLDFVIDRSPYKQGRYIPGVRIPICAPEKLIEKMPDYTLLLAWNLADEVLKQQSEYRRLGGRFILPIPEVKIL